MLWGLFYQKGGGNINDCLELFLNSSDSLLPAELVEETDGFEYILNSLHWCSFGGKDYYGYKPIILEEEDIARFAALRSTKKHAFDPRINAFISLFESNEGISLDEEQKNAVKMFCTEHFGILTGGPGTGKTSVLKCALYVLNKIFEDNPKKILLCAPTGKAARRMTEATGMCATTLLGALEYNPVTKRAGRLIDADILFIDEASMTDDVQMTLLVRNCPKRTRVFLIGDNEQLPPVGRGAVLRDLLTFKVVPKVRLVKTFRQKEGSTLLTNIQIVREGYKRRFVDGNDFITFERLDGIMPLYYSEVKKRGLENVIILSPTRKEGKYCSENLNRAIQKNLNCNDGVKGQMIRDGRNLVLPFRIGDPVMQLVNRKAVANGEIGTVIDLNPVSVQFGQTVISYRGRDLFQLDLAYSISIHKSQGSEYEAVFVLCSDEGNLDRNMIYTAITRAKKQCYVFGKNSLIKKACEKQTSMERITWLSRFDTLVL